MVWCWPCRLDAVHAMIVSELTIKRYEHELKDFVEWLLMERHNMLTVRAGRTGRRTMRTPAPVRLGAAMN